MVVYSLIARVTQDLSERRVAFLFVALSSGLGWLALAAGHQGTSDLFIPESNTLFSLHINPHFPLAVALMIGMMLEVGSQKSEVGCRRSDVGSRRSEIGRVAALALMSLVLVIVQPFAGSASLYYARRLFDFALAA